MFGYSNVEKIAVYFPGRSKATIRNRIIKVINNLDF